MKLMHVGLLALAVCVSGAASARGPIAGQASYQPKTARGVAVQHIVRTWADYSYQVYGTPPLVWAKSMQDTFAEASVGNLQRAAKMQTFEGMMGVLLGQKTSDSKIIDARAKDMEAASSLSFSPTPTSIGSSANDLVYTMVTPCRILDTRSAIGRLTAGVTRNFFVHGASFTAQGGANSTCNIPADPSAVVINVLAVNPALDGFLSVFPLGGSATSSSLNYTGGRNLANEIIAKTTTGQANDLSVVSERDVDLVIDIVGYYMAPVATALSCTQTANSADVVLDPFTRNGSVSAPACAAGYTRVATISNMSGDVFNLSTVTPDNGSGMAFYHYNGTSNASVRAASRCCQIPGR